MKENLELELTNIAIKITITSCKRCKVFNLILQIFRNGWNTDENL